MKNKITTLDWHIPYLTAGLPGVSGALRVTPEDFDVREIPAYEPCGTGEHTFFAVEKCELSTPQLVKDIARALGVQTKQISYAGLKDTHAITEQTLSVWNMPPARLLGLELNRARVLWAKRHTNKLRTGHLHGNRFTIRLRHVHAEAASRAEAILRVLMEQGVPNGYGIQRFGNYGDNHRVGWMLLHNRWNELRERGIRSPSYRQRRFYVSALQSALFNRYLTTRMQQGTWDALLPGDLAKKHPAGGIFTVEDVATELPRVTAGEISATGPIYGYKLMQPAGEAAALEEQLLSDLGLTPEDFRRVKAPGTRRHLRYLVTDLSWQMVGDSLVISFTAPKGSYATMLLRELMKDTSEHYHSAALAT